MQRYAVVLLGAVLVTSALALAAFPPRAPTDAVPSGSLDPWAGHEDEWVVARLWGNVAFDGPSVSLAPGAFEWEEASAALRLSAPHGAPFDVRGAFLLDDGSLRLVPLNAPLGVEGATVLAILLPDLLRLDIRPAGCPVTFPESGRTHEAPVGTALAPQERLALRFGPADGCSASELGIAFLARADAP